MDINEVFSGKALFRTRLLERVIPILHHSAFANRRGALNCHCTREATSSRSAIRNTN